MYDGTVKCSQGTCKCQVHLVSRHEESISLTLEMLGDQAPHIVAPQPLRASYLKRLHTLATWVRGINLVKNQGCTVY